MSALMLIEIANNNVVRMGTIVLRWHLSVKA
jgi:hypothetical protein